MLLDLGYLATIAPHYFWHRLFTGKYGPKAPEKWGYVPEGAGSKPCAMFHAVSVGETIAAKGLIGEFRRQFPDWDVRVSVTTATGREVAEKQFGADNVCYYPLDLSWTVRRAFERIKPSLVVLLELEVWPQFLGEALRRKTPVVVSNVRITERSTRRFSWFGSRSGEMLNRVSLWLCQSELYRDRLRSLGVREERLLVAGSLKYDSVPTEIDPAIREEYRRLIGVGSEKVIVGGSTHPGEEDALVDACLKLRESMDCKLVLVPRHPERVGEVEQAGSRFGAVTRRSDIAAGGACETPVLLVDTVGELARLYAAADVVFIGGTLISHGGQNMMEPCGLALPTIVGPSCFNFAEAIEVLLSAGGVRQITSAAELGDALDSLLGNPEAAREMAIRGREALLAKKGATAYSMELIRDLIQANG